MNKLNLSKIIKDAQVIMSRHSPEILTGIGIAGMVTTTIFAVGATPKAIKLIEAKKKEKNLDRLTPLETVKTTWKCYIPAAVTGTASVACLIGASRVSLKRNAALATAYKLSETALAEYKEKVVETIGEKKEQAIKDSIAKDHVEQNPVTKSEVIITDVGNTLCYDHLSGRYFTSNMEHIKRSVNLLNRRMMNEMYMSLNEFYDELGLDHIQLGNDLGWNIDDGLIDVYFSSQLADDGRPAVVVNYSVAPKRNYSSFM